MTGYSAMGAIAAELRQFSCCQAQLAISTGDGRASRSGSNCSAVAFRRIVSNGLSISRRNRLVSSSAATGRWLPLTQNQSSEWKLREQHLNAAGGGERAVRTRRRSVTVCVATGQLGPKPTYVPLEGITGEEHFHQILNEAVERNQPVVVDWLAAWCRKCIYLKPKLEKLAVEFYPDIKFYYVDVNVVPQSLVKFAEVTKMPTIQLWKNGKRQGEIIGGHQVWLVVDEVREMIKLTK